jgi:hypothetical protein
MGFRGHENEEHNVIVNCAVVCLATAGRETNFPKPHGASHGSGRSRNSKGTINATTRFGVR